MINLTQGFSKETINEFSRQIGAGDLCASLLLSRGIDNADKARRFLYGTLKDLTNPFLYSGIKEAVAIIRDAIYSDEKILVYGDYDCDGIGAVSILMRAFTGKGIKAEYYIPVRADEGYGLNIDAIERIRDTYNPSLIISVDCGISAVNVIQQIQEYGIKMIVTDHHKAGDILPDCTIINPCLNPELTQLCGAGVAFTLVRALYGDDYAYNFLDICALSTVADIVPLVGDNRLIVKFGIGLIRSSKAKTGVKELINKAGLMPKAITSTDIAFKLAPRLNAAGRLDTAQKSVQLLLTDDVTKAMLISSELNIQNEERQAIEKNIINEAKQKLEKYDFGKYKIIILYDPNWNEGVNGIAAARITEQFNLPTILLSRNADGILKGSARSISQVNIYNLINTQKHLLSSFGGHAMAAGLSLKEENFEAFCEGINAELIKLPSDAFVRNTYFDAEISLNGLDEKTIREINLMEPFGYKNPVPVFCDVNPNVKFSMLKEQHIKSSCKVGDIISFGKAYELPAYNTANNKSIIYNIEQNYFNGNYRNQIKIKMLYYDGYVVSDEVLLENFAKFSVEIKFNNMAKTCNSGAELHVFFNCSDFNDFCDKNANLAKIYAKCDKFNLINSAILSPDPSFPFAYYGKIFVHGSVSDSIKKYFENIGAFFVDGGAVSMPEYNIGEMRETYKIIRNFRSYLKIASVRDLYAKLLSFGYNYSYSKFVLYFYIMLDVGLLKKVKDDILEVSDKKANIDDSALYGYLWKQR